MNGMKHWQNDNNMEKLSFQSKTCPRATLSTTNPKQTVLKLNSGLHSVSFLNTPYSYLSW
jgi:hypothetical protein